MLPEVPKTWLIKSFKIKLLLKQDSCSHWWLDSSNLKTIYQQNVKNKIYLIFQMHFVMLSKRDTDPGPEVLARVCPGWPFYHCFQTDVCRWCREDLCENEENKELEFFLNDKIWKIINLPNSIHIKNKFQIKYLLESFHTMIGLTI